MSKKEIVVVEQTGLSTRITDFLWRFLGLKNPGDKWSARITNTGRRVMKAEKNNGADKYSETRYQNGTIVETRTTKTR